MATEKQEREWWFQSIAEGEHGPLHNWLAVSHNEDGTLNGGSVTAPDGSALDGAHLGVRRLTTVGRGTATPVEAANSYDPMGVGFPYTFDPRMVAGAAGTLQTNTGYYMRVTGGFGKIKGLAVRIGTASGNIELAVFAGQGRGRHNRPGKRIVTTGVVAMAANGWQEFDFAAPVVVKPGDFFFLWTDNTTASFKVSTAGLDDLASGNNLGALSSGIAYYQSSLTAGSNISPSPSGGGSGHFPCIIGVPADDRSVILSADQTWEGTMVAEPNVWWDTAHGEWVMIYSGGSPTSLGWATAPSDPHLAASWTKHGQTLGEGFGGESGAADESSLLLNADGTVYKDGSGNLYLYYPNPTTGKLNVAVGTPWDGWTIHTDVFTPSGADTTNVYNTGAIMDADGTVRMLFEAKLTNFQIGSCHASSPLGPFTQDTFPIADLQVDRGMYGGPFLIKQGSLYVVWYHSALGTGGLPTDIYRATSTTADFSGGVTAEPRPVIARAITEEVDQSADVVLATDPVTKVTYGFWSAMQNSPSVTGHIVANDPDWLPLAY